VTAVAHPPPGVPEGLVEPGESARGPALEAWRTLARDARHPNPFQGPDLLLPALRHLAPADGPVRLWVHAGSEPGSLDMLAPVVTGRRHRRLPWRASVGWQHTHHFLGTPLVSPHLGPEGWRAALDALAASTADTWLVLGDVDDDVARDLEAAAARDGRGTRRLAEASRPVTVRHTHDDYVERQLGGSRRKELRRCFRRLSESVGGGLGVVELVSTRGVGAAVEAFLALEAAGWKGHDGGAMGVRPHERAWFTESARAAAAHGGIEVLALVGDHGDPVAMAVDLTTDRVRFTFKIAYDEQHASWSPGLLLLLEQLHRFHATGAGLLDSCAVPGHPMATRLHPDGRTLVTLAVGLRGRRGSLAARTAPGLLAAGEATRGRVHDVRRRLTDRRSTATPTAPTPTAPAPTPGGTAP